MLCYIEVKLRKRKMKVVIAVIGGTGLDNPDLMKDKKELRIADQYFDYLFN